MNKGNFEIYFFYDSNSISKIINDLKNSEYLTIEEIVKDNWIEQNHSKLDTNILGNLGDLHLNENDEVTINLKDKVDPSIRIFALYANRYFFVYFGFKKEHSNYLIDIKKIVNWTNLKKLASLTISGFELEFDFDRIDNYEHIFKRKSNLPVFINGGGEERIFFNGSEEQSKLSVGEIKNILDYLELTDIPRLINR